MKSSLLRLALLVLAIAGAPVMARAQTNQAQPPGQISYQGYLTDANGVPLATNTPQNFNILFNIYSAASGGTPLWGESQVATVSQGFFTVLLGVGNSIPNSATYHTNDLTFLFNTNNAQSRYIGITVGGLGTGEIVPRLRLLSSPYALLASTAVYAGYATNAQYVTGAQTISSTNLGPDIGLWSVSGGNVYRASGNVGIGTSTPGVPLDFASVLGDKIALWPGNATAGAVSYGFGIQNSTLQIHSDTAGSVIAFGYGSSASMTEEMRIQNGNVGIGTTSPGAMLQVIGPIRNGSETGTSQGPNRAGVVHRRINSTSAAVGQVVAASLSGNMLMERDGTSGGIRIHWLAAYGPTVISGHGVNSSGGYIGINYVISPSAGQYQQIFAEGSAVAHFELSFGDAFLANDMTDIVLTRTVGAGYDDYYWVGSVTSTYNQ